MLQSQAEVNIDAPNPLPQTTPQHPLAYNFQSPFDFQQMNQANMTQNHQQMNEILYGRHYMHTVQFNNENGTFIEQYRQAYADGTNINSNDANFHHNANIEMNHQPEPQGSNQNCTHLYNDALIAEISQQI